LYKGLVTNDLTLMQNNGWMDEHAYFGWQKPYMVILCSVVW
jgi:hypothetical protein